MFKLRIRRNTSMPTARVETRRQYRGVTIKTAGSGACPRARMFVGKRFLASEAPALPLPECGSRSACRCVYVHFRDRRAAPRRDADVGLPQRLHEPERRNVAGRRASDRR